MSNGYRVFRSSPRNLVGAIAGMLVFGWFFVASVLHILRPASAVGEGSWMDPLGSQVTSRAAIIAITVGWAVFFLLCVWFAVIWINVTIEISETGLVSHNVLRQVDFSAAWTEINRLEHGRGRLGGDRYVLRTNAKRLKLNSTFGTATDVILQIKRYAPHVLVLKT